MENSLIKLIQFLRPALANLFMGYNEQKQLESNHGRLVKFYRRYVDDIFCLFENGHQALTFVDFLNSQQPKFKFHYIKRTYETTPIFECSQYSFRYFNYQCLQEKYIHSTFRELQQFCTIYIQELIDLTFRLNNTWDGFYLDLEKLKVILQKSECPPKSIDKAVNKYLN